LCEPRRITLAARDADAQARGPCRDGAAAAGRPADRAVRARRDLFVGRLRRRSARLCGAARPCFCGLRSREMKFELTEEQRAMVGSVRGLAQEKFKPRVKKWQDGTFPHENIKDLAEIGVLGMGVPEEYGGLGLPVLDCVIVLEEIAKVCYVTAMAVMSAMGAQNRIISVYAPDHVKQKFLPGVVTGDVILAICMTEPHAGTDVANYRT